jgi:hypothetical protein
MPYGKKTELGRYHLTFYAILFITYVIKIVWYIIIDSEHSSLWLASYVPRSRTGLRRG